MFNKQLTLFINFSVDFCSHTLVLSCFLLSSRPNFETKLNELTGKVLIY